LVSEVVQRAPAATVGWQALPEAVPEQNPDVQAASLLQAPCEATEALAMQKPTLQRPEAHEIEEVPVRPQAVPVAILVSQTPVTAPLHQEPLTQAPWRIPPRTAGSYGWLADVHATVFARAVHTLFVHRRPVAQRALLALHGAPTLRLMMAHLPLWQDKPPAQSPLTEQVVRDPLVMQPYEIPVTMQTLLTHVRPDMHVEQAVRGVVESHAPPIVMVAGMNEFETQKPPQHRPPVAHDPAVQASRSHHRP
jgi:hypothetical protein